jgi:hypothetical protein
MKMDLFQQILFICASVSKLEVSGEEFESILRYITNGRDYKERVKRAHKSKFTFLLLSGNRRQPRPMNTLEQFLNGGWRRCRWEGYELKNKTRAGHPEKSSGVKKTGIFRRLILAFLGAFIVDLLLSFIIWIVIMMGISELDVANKFLSELDPLNLFIWIWLILFGLFFLGFLGFIKPK